jgi:hypothetical protein
MILKEDVNESNPEPVIIDHGPKYMTIQKSVRTMNPPLLPTF